MEGKGEEEGGKVEVPKRREEEEARGGSCPAASSVRPSFSRVIEEGID